MRSLCKLGLVLGVVVVLASPAPAQGPGGRFGGSGLLGLATNKSVQGELKLTEEQATKVKDVVQQVRDKHKDEQEALQKIEDVQERFQKFGELRKTMSNDFLKDVADVLKPDQVKRLKQIDLQTRRSFAFQDPDVQKELNLTDDQKDKIKTIGEDARKEMREIGQGGQGNQEETRKKFAALQKDVDEKIQAVLTPEQKKSWKEMTGEPFEIKFEPGQFGKGKGGKKKRDP